MLEYVYFNKKIVASNEAKMSIASQSIQYGATVFGGIRGYYREKSARIFRLKDHHERLNNSAKILGIDFHITFDDFQKIVFDLLDKNHIHQDFYIRPFLYTLDESIRPKYFDTEFDMGVYLVPLNTYFDTDKGLKLMISSWKKTPDASIPSKAKAGGGYINSSLATAEAVNAGYDEALVMDDQWNITEGSVSNLLIVYRGKIITSPLGSDILEGVTLRSILTFLEDMGYEISYDWIDRSLIYTADEVLLTGTAVQIMRAESVDGRTIGNRAIGNSEDQTRVFDKIKKGFQDVIDLKKPKYKHWITEYHL